MFYIYLFIFGSAIGSFLNVLVDRLSNEESINGRSHCDYCKKTIPWYDLFPIVSYLLLKGRCRNCHKHLSLYYPLVEYVTGISFVLIWGALPQSILGQGLAALPTTIYLLKFIYLGIISCLIVIFFSDMKYHVIPDQIQVVLFGLSLFLLPFYGFTPQVFITHAIAAIIVMAPIMFLYYITKGRGMGFGDVKLAFTIGFMFGIKGGMAVLYLAFIFGAIVGIMMMLLKKRGLKSKIAFGPFLVIGMLIILFFKDQLFAVIGKIYGI